MLETLTRAALPLVAAATVFGFAAAARANPVITLDPSSVVGNYYGTLDTTFTVGTYPGSFLADYAVPGTNDQVEVDLMFVSEDPGEYYLYGGMGLDEQLPVGGGGGLFLAGETNDVTSQGFNSAAYPVVFTPETIFVTDQTEQFVLDMPWNGVSSNWTGTWQVTWIDPAQPVNSVPDSTALWLGIPVLVALAAAPQRLRAYARVD